jgi:hypothetical protein
MMSATLYFYKVILFLLDLVATKRFQDNIIILTVNLNYYWTRLPRICSESVSLVLFALPPVCLVAQIFVPNLRADRYCI